MAVGSGEVSELCMVYKWAAVRLVVSEEGWSVGWVALVE